MFCFSLLVFYLCLCGSKAKTNQDVRACPFAGCIDRTLTMRGQCYWFWRANPGKDGVPIRKCKYGSLCRFMHLTRQETRDMETLQQEQEATPEQTTSACLRCNGTGRHAITIVNTGDHDRQDTMRCFECEATGILHEHPNKTKIRMLYKKAHFRDWCQCRGDSRTFQYHPDHTHPKCVKHCYTCLWCRGFTQIG